MHQDHSACGLANAPLAEAVRTPELGVFRVQVRAGLRCRAFIVFRALKIEKNCYHHLTPDGVGLNRRSTRNKEPLLPKPNGFTPPSTGYSAHDLGSPCCSSSLATPALAYIENARPDLGQWH